MISVEKPPTLASANIAATFYALYTLKYITAVFVRLRLIEVNGSCKQCLTTMLISRILAW